MPYKDKAKHRAFQLQWTQSRRHLWLKENGPCAHCGSDQELEVDHIDPSKKVSHRIWSWSDKRREEELAKCQVLCKACNKFKADTLRVKLYPHGTWQRYNVRNTELQRRCRCKACTEANTKWCREKKTTPRSSIG